MSKIVITKIVITKRVICGAVKFERLGDGPIRVSVKGRGPGIVSAEDMTTVLQALDAEVSSVGHSCDHHCHHWHWWNTSPMFTYNTSTTGTYPDNATYTLDMNGTSATVANISGTV